MQLQNSLVKDFVGICQQIERDLGEKVPLTDSLQKDVQKAATVLQNAIDSPAGHNAHERLVSKQLARDLKAQVLRIGELLQRLPVGGDEKAQAVVAEPVAAKSIDAPAIDAVAIKTLAKALAHITLHPIVLHPDVHYREVTLKERAAVHPKYASHIRAACEKARKSLEARGINCTTRIQLAHAINWRPAITEQIFTLVYQYLHLLATAPINAEAHPISNDVHKLFYCEKGSKEHSAYFTYLNACLDCLDKNLLKIVADNAADALIWPSRHIHYPVGEGGGLMSPPGFYDPLRLIVPKTAHSSVSQLFAAAFLDDLSRLTQCLTALGDACAALTTQPDDWFHVKFTLLEIAIAQDSLKCAGFLLQRNPKLSRSAALSWQCVRSPEMARLLIKAGIAPSPHIFARSILPRSAWRQDPRRYNGCWYDNPEKWINFLGDFTRQFPALLQAADGGGNTVIEALYFGASQSATCEAFFVAVVKNALPLSLKITRDIEARYLMNKEKKWFALLPAARRQECERLVASPNLLSSSLIRLKELSISLELQLKVHNLDPESIDTDLIVRAHVEKKSTKKLLKELADGAEKAAALVEYGAFVKLYDQAVDRHPIFRRVRECSRALRAAHVVQATSPLQKFLGFWMEEVSFTQATRDIWRTASFGVRTRIAKATADVQNLGKRQRFLKLVHGTSSASLPTILQLGSLQASGKLFKAGIAPLAGEGSSSAVSGYNITGISMAPPNTAWEQRALMGSATPLLYSETFAMKSEYHFVAAHSYGVVESGCQLILTGNSFPKEFGEENPAAFWFGFKRAIMRLKMTENLEFMKKTAPQLAKLKERFARCPEVFAEGLQECIGIWEAAPKVQLDPTSWMITAPHPLLFGSSSYAREKPSTEWSVAMANEIVVKKDLILGGDLDLLFTSTAALERVKEAVKAFDIQAFTIDSARLLEMRQMTLGSVKRDQFISGSALSTEAFHRDVLLYYAAPFPQNPSCRRQGQRVVLRKPEAYDAYKKEFEAGRALARATHGAMHATRVGLFALMLKNIYASVGIKLEVSPQMLLATAGLHDAARQGDGADIWNDESAEIARHYVRDYIFNLKQDLIPAGLLDTIEHAIRDKDAREYTTVMQRIVSDADRFDVVRTLSDPKKEFCVEQVALTTLPQFKDFPIRALMDEIMAFVAITENSVLKLHLEHFSQDYLRDVALIFCFIHAKEKRFPLMEKYLSADMKDLAGSALLDKATLAVVNQIVI